MIEIFKAVGCILLLALILTVYLPIAWLVAIIGNAIYFMVKAGVLVFGGIIVVLVLLVHFAMQPFKTVRKYE